MTASAAQEMMDGLRLPPHVHATVLAGRDVTTGESLAYPVVWADRVLPHCPRCRQPVPREVEQCPVMLDTGAGQGGRLLEWDQQHGCGEWLSVTWREVEAEPGDEDAAEAVEQAAGEVATARQEELEQERGSIRRRLARDLKWTLQQLSTPLDEGETPRERIDAVSAGVGDPGTVLEPGVYLDRDEAAWVAWDFDPASEDGADVIQEMAHTVPVTAAATMLGRTHQRVSTLAGEGKLERGDDGRITVASLLARMEVY